MKMATMCMLMILESYGTEFYFCLRHSNFLTRIILKWVSLYVETKQNFLWSNTSNWNEVMYKIRKESVYQFLSQWYCWNEFHFP